MYCLGSLHSITLFFFDVLSFHWHFRWMPDIQNLKLVTSPPLKQVPQSYHYLSILSRNNTAFVISLSGMGDRNC